MHVPNRKPQGVDAKGRVGQLVTLLDHYDYDSLTTFFHSEF